MILNGTNMFVYIFIVLKIFVLQFHLFPTDEIITAAAAYTFNAWIYFLSDIVTLVESY